MSSYSDLFAPALVAGFIGAAVVIYLLLAAIPATLAFIVLKRLPLAYRRQSPGLAFLLLIPFFSLVWAFFVHPKVAESLRDYFHATNQPKPDDGEKLALWLCICPIIGFVPLIGVVAGLATLVLLVMFYVKAFELSAQIPAAHRGYAGN